MRSAVTSPTMPRSLTDSKSLNSDVLPPEVYGSTRTPFTWDFFHELATKAAFRHVTRCKFRHTASRWPEIVELDNRERETLFVEVAK